MELIMEAIITINNPIEGTTIIEVVEVVEEEDVANIVQYVRFIIKLVTLPQIDIFDLITTSLPPIPQIAHTNELMLAIHLFFVANRQTVNDPSLYVDSGATNHITYDLSNLSL